MQCYGENEQPHAAQLLELRSPPALDEVLMRNAFIQQADKRRPEQHTTDHDDRREPLVDEIDLATSSPGMINEKKDAASITPAAKPSIASLERREISDPNRIGSAPSEVTSPAIRLAAKPRRTGPISNTPDPRSLSR